MPTRRGAHKSSFDPRTITENIVDTPLNDEMSKSFLEYAYSVIYARALPDARDGMKPVQRRIIYQMGHMNLTPDRPYMKSARVVGEVMGKLHPHGDSAIYEAMVRLAQPFAMRLPLVDGHGNFGSLDDGPAASRYTEARLAPPSLGMNANIDENTVSFSSNYDNKLKEPDVLPSAIPNLLVNGASGIAVGMATNMITHNLSEVVNGAKYLMKNPDASVDDLMQFIPGPDLPGGGIIMGREGITEAYKTGRGAFKTRARVHIENITARKKGIIVTQLPFMIGPEKILERISDGVKNKKLTGISGVVDLTDRHHGMRIVIEIKTGFNPEAVLATLYKHTPLEDSYTINNVALVDGRPHTMGLKELLAVWIKHRRLVISARTQFRLEKAQERLHLVEGLLLALLDIDEVIEVIRSSDNADIARKRLIEIFDLDEIQASYILDLRLRRLTKMSQVELESERDELHKTIQSLMQILDSIQRRDDVVIQEMDDVVKKWGDSRRTILLDNDNSVVSVDTTSFTPQPDGISLNDKSSVTSQSSLASATALDSANILPLKTTALPHSLKIEDKPCCVLLSSTGLIARTNEDAENVYSTRSESTPRAPHDDIQSIFATTTHQKYGLITSAGRLITAQVSDLPEIETNESVSVSNGVHADDLLNDTQSTDPIENEHVIAAIDIDTKTPIALGTRHGIVKRWNLDSPTTMDSWTIINLKDDDSLLAAAPASDTDRLVFISDDAHLLTFNAKLVRPQGRLSAGMAGMKLKDNHEILCFAVVPDSKIKWTEAQFDEDNHQISSAHGTVVLTVAGDSNALEGTEDGFAKITPLEVYPQKGRATGGVRVQRFLKNQDTLINACVGLYPLHAFSESGRAMNLPDIDMKRDGSGEELPTRIYSVA